MRNILFTAWNEWGEGVYLEPLDFSSLMLEKVKENERKQYTDISQIEWFQNGE